MRIFLTSFTWLKLQATLEKKKWSNHKYNRIRKAPNNNSTWFALAEKLFANKIERTRFKHNWWLPGMFVQNVFYLWCFKWLSDQVTYSEKKLLKESMDKGKNERNTEKMKSFCLLLFLVKIIGAEQNGSQCPIVKTFSPL